MARNSSSYWKNKATLRPETSDAAVSRLFPVTSFRVRYDGHLSNLGPVQKIRLFAYFAARFGDSGNEASQDGQQNAQFEAGEHRSDTIMWTTTEGKVRIRVTVNLQAFAVGENGFVTIGGRYPYDDAVARSNPGLPKGYVGGGGPHHMCRWRSPTQNFLDGCIQQLGVPAQPLPGSRISGEGKQGTGHR